MAGLALLLIAGAASAQYPSPVSTVPVGPPRPLSAAMTGDPLPPSTIAPKVEATRYQPKEELPAPRPEGPTELTLSLEPPGNQILHKLDSESQLFERMRQQAKERRPPENIVFPEEPVLTKSAYLGRAWPQRTCTAEPNFLVYERLYFEEMNGERYGWDFGIVSPVIETAAFYKNLALFPYHCGTDPFRKYESNAGLCLPGDPVPYMCYPFGLSASGAMFESGAILTLLAVFP
jgi:hypothetical protein